MTVPLTARIGALVLATTAFYTYVGQMVPQKEVQPPKEVVLSAELTTADMVKVGREIMEGKGLCLTCHTIGKSGALRFPDLDGVDVRAKNRIPGLSDVEYFAQSLYDPNSYIVAGFNPGMPAINKPPIALTDQEILCVIAYLQTLGGTPTVTLQTTHRYLGAPASPGAAPPPGGPPAQEPEPGKALPLDAPPATGAAPGGARPAAPSGEGAELRPAVSSPDVVSLARRAHTTVSRTARGGVVRHELVAAHQTAARIDGAVVP